MTQFRSKEAITTMVSILGALVILTPLMVSANSLHGITHAFNVSTNVTLNLDIAKMMFDAEAHNFAIELRIDTSAPVNYELINSGHAVFRNIQPITEDVLLFQDGWFDFFSKNFQLGRGRTLKKTIFEIAFEVTENTSGTITFTLKTKVALEELAPINGSINETVVVISPDLLKEQMMTTFPISMTVALESRLIDGLARLEMDGSDRVKIAFGKCNLQTVDRSIISTDQDLDKETSTILRLLGYLTCPTDQTKSFHIITGADLPTAGPPCFNMKNDDSLTIFFFFSLRCIAGVGVVSALIYLLAYLIDEE
ncbi:unnamed protein product [Caenorhabditis sp. 36 PRJEB53466]|nr:unnamed protein product [Caenorhabditis sp. 36 PRJEB53466]